MESAITSTEFRERSAAQDGGAPPARARHREHFLFHHSSDALLLMELGGTVIEANPASLELMRCTRESLLRQRVWGVIVGAEELEIREWLRCLPRNQPATVQLVLRPQEGRLRRVEARVVRVLDEDYGRDLIVVSCREAQQASRVDRRQRREVVQLQRHNRALVEAEQRLRLAMELGRVGLWVWNATDTTNPGHWSDRLKEIFGLPLDAEVTHDMFLKRVHPGDRERIDEAVRAALGGKDGGAYQLEYRTVPQAGPGPNWVLARGQAFFDERGQPLRFIGTVVDITQRKLAEESLARLNSELEHRIARRTVDLAHMNEVLTQEIAERLRAEATLQQNKNSLRLAIDTIPGLVWSSLPDGNIEYLNQRWLDYTGLTLEDAAGWGWQVAIHPEDLPALVRYWKARLESGTGGETEARLRRHDGAYRWFLFRCVPLFDETGGIFKWYGTNTDVEERRNSERIARGQSEALIQTLTALSQETMPDRLLEHVLRAIGGHLGAHSIAVWEMNEKTGQVELVANCEGDRMHVQTDEERQHSAGVHLRDSSHPVWEEFFRTGKYCLAGVLDAKGARVRELNGTDTPWYDWNSGQVANPRVPALLRHLHDSGVTGTLSVPTFIAGRVTGFLSIRFRGKQDFKCEEIELARALAHQAMLALQLMRLSRESHRMAVIEERHRMARELHDALAQGITGVIIQLEAAEDAASRHLSEEVDQHLKRARELARGSLRDARRTVHAMRPSALKNRDLCGALAALFKDMTEPAGMRTSFVQRGHPVKLGPKVEENLLRITQEVLTNAIRHAQAAHFSGRLAFGKRQVRLLLLDNGRGFDPSISHDGFGLTGIRERVEGMGGRLCLRTAPGRGTAILIRLPGPGETFRSLIQA